MHQPIYIRTRVTFGFSFFVYLPLFERLDVDAYAT